MNLAWRTLILYALSMTSSLVFAETAQVASSIVVTNMVIISPSTETAASVTPLVADEPPRSPPLGADVPVPRPRPPMTTPAATDASEHPCTRRLLRSARQVAGYYRRNGIQFGGRCAYAVRLALNLSGIHSGGGLGHAFQMGPGIRGLGYVNVLNRTMNTPEEAPVGAILVYGKARPGARHPGGGRCRGLGARYGHVEIKDKDGYIYDGKASRHIQRSQGVDCRPLIGIYVPGPRMGGRCG
jgi:hypothetical protein